MTKEFKIVSDYSPAGDQPEAISKIVKGINSGLLNQTLLGVTGSGKTFTVANVIQELQRPAIVMAHNKTLAAQLYGEFKELFECNLFNKSAIKATKKLTYPMQEYEVSDVMHRFTYVI